MQELLKLLKALSDKNRLRILRLLQKRKMCVCELAFVLGITQPSISRHLKKLYEAGIIESEQDRFWTNYYLRNANKKANIILSCIGRCLTSDNILKKDLEKFRKADRVKLCCKNKNKRRHYG